MSQETFTPSQSAKQTNIRSHSVAAFSQQSRVLRTVVCLSSVNCIYVFMKGKWVEAEAELFCVSVIRESHMWSPANARSPAGLGSSWCERCRSASAGEQHGIGHMLCVSRTEELVMRCNIMQYYNSIELWVLQACTQCAHAYMLHTFDPCQLSRVTLTSHCTWLVICNEMHHVYIARQSPGVNSWNKVDSNRVQSHMFRIFTTPLAVRRCWVVERQYLQLLELVLRSQLDCWSPTDVSKFQQVDSSLWWNARCISESLDCGL